MTYNRNKWLSLSSCIIGALTIAYGCVDKTTLDNDGGGATDSQSISIGYLKTYYKGYATPITKLLEINGTITALDQFGSFPNTLVVEDATGGIEVKVGDDLLPKQMHIGESILIRCQGLTLGNYGGMISLGAPSANDAYENSFINKEFTQVYIKPSGTVTELLPRIVTVASLTADDVGRYVAFEKVQFIDEEMRLRWGDPEKECDRHLVSPSGDTLLVRVVKSSGFVTRPLPQGSGYIEGILTLFNRTYQLRPISNRGAVMEATRFRVGVPPKSYP